MAHTISALTMIINRSVDASKGTSSSGRGFFPNNVPVDLEKVMDEIVAFSQWQADGTGIEVVMEPLPVDLPDEIMMDEKWLKDDLLCLAGNAVKYSRSNQGMPAVLRVAIVPAPTEGTSTVPSPLSVQFTFIDSGYPLPDEMLTTIFNRPMHSERMQTGGMGLGLYCLSEHMQALQVCRHCVIALCSLTCPDLSLTTAIATFIGCLRNTRNVFLCRCCFLVVVVAMTRDDTVPGGVVTGEKAQRYGSVSL